MLTFILIAAAVVSAAPSPSCAVGVSLREAGKTAATNADTLINLDADQSVTVAVNLINQGNVQDFTMSLQPTNVDVMNGDLSQSFSLASTGTTSQSLTVRGKALGSGCNYGSRLLRVELRPQNQTTGPACGVAEIHFICKPNEKVPRALMAATARAATPDTVWKPQPGSVGRAEPSLPAQARRDTVWARDR